MTYPKKYNVTIFEDRTEWQNLNGQLDREGGPAVEYNDGTKYWNKEGKLHRQDGPAVEYINGDKFWYKEGKLHRLDGPAVECANGNKYWYKEGIRHRLDGPAIERRDCTNGKVSKSYWLEGVEYTRAEFDSIMSKKAEEHQDVIIGDVTVVIGGKNYKLHLVKG